MLLRGKSSGWDTNPVSTSVNQLIARESNGTQSVNSVHNFNNRNIPQPILTEQFLNNHNQLKQVNNLGINQMLDNSANTKLVALLQQLTHLQAALSANPGNVQFVAAVNKVQQEISLIQSQQSLQGQLVKEQAKIKQDTVHRFLLLQQQQQQQKQQQQQQLQQLLNYNQQSQISLNNLNTSSASIVNNNNNQTLPLISNESNTFSNMSLTTTTTNNSVISQATSNGTSAKVSSSSSIPVCRLCNKAYNSSTQLPKILGCTHTFCLRCLHVVAQQSVGELQCPGRCGVATQLSTAGVAGLTTNQAIVSALTNNNALSQYNGNSQESTSSMDNFSVS